MSDQLADAAQTRHADRLTEDFGARELERFQVCSRNVASAAGICRAADSSNATACSAALWMFDVGALTTNTPRSVAASTSTLSRPTAGAGDDLEFGRGQHLGVDGGGRTDQQRVGVGHRGQQLLAVRTV